MNNNTEDQSPPAESHIIRQKFSVPFEYPVIFTRHVFDSGNTTLASVFGENPGDRPHRVQAYVDSGVVAAQPDILEQISAYFTNRAKSMTLVCRPEVIPGGERAKLGWEPVKRIMASIGNNHLCRHSYVLAVGGGSVLDMVGFAASLVHRGVRLIRVPTTVLAQNDAGVGVKTAMDEHGMKNFVGTFAPPHAVLIDFEFLKTLEFADWTGGIAEAFKVAIIKDAAFLEWLCKTAPLLRERHQEAMEVLVRRCAALHLDHIRTSGDPFELGTARPLDFGHWSSHKLEVLSDYKLGHGLAVAIGIALDLFIACAAKRISEADRDRMVRAIRETGLPIWSDLLERKTKGNRLDILAGLDDFREHLGGQLTLTLPDGIGRKVEVHEIDESVILRGIEWLKETNSEN